MTTQVGALDSSYVSLINSIMTVEKQPLQALTTQRDNLTVQRGIYTDLSSMMSTFQTATQSLISTNAFYALQDGRNSSVVSLSSGASVLTASASSSAVPGQYTISVSSLAKSHRVRSDLVEYTNQPLNMTGSFVIGGAATSSFVTDSATNGVTGFGLGNVAAGEEELASDTYYVETRLNGAQWEYRLVNQDGEAVSIQDQSNSGSFTTGWQAVPENGGTVDTGRGLTFDLDANLGNYTIQSRQNGASKVEYTAKGATINVDANDTLVDLAYQINHAKYADGNEVTAAIVNNQLILTNNRSGEGHLIQASNISGDAILTKLGILANGSFKNGMDTPTSAIFTVNNLQVTRSQNDNLSDVIQGMTLNLASDAAGKSAVINVTADASNAKSTIDSFISQFNSMQKYLKSKTSTSKNSDGTYTRGALAGDTMFYNLRLDLLKMINGNSANNGTLKNLSEIGITLSDDLTLTVSDSSKLLDALENNKDNVTALIDSVMGKIDNRLSQFTGTSGYVATSGNALDNQIKNADSQIDTMNQRLSDRQAALYQQYGELQNQILMMTYMQAQLSAIYGTYSSSG